MKPSLHVGFLCILLLLQPLRGEKPKIEAEEPELPETVIECDHLEMLGTDEEARFLFTGNVRVTGNNIHLTCEELEVIALREPDPEAAIGEFGRFRSLIASGSVHLVQGSREAICERAEILPGEDKIVLTGNPVVRDEQGYATGPRMTLYRDERRAVIEGTPEERARIVLPPIKDLGFDESQTTEPDAASQP